MYTYVRRFKFYQFKMSEMFARSLFSNGIYCFTIQRSFQHDIDITIIIDQMSRKWYWSSFIIYLWYNEVAEHSSLVVHRNSIKFVDVCALLSIYALLRSLTRLYNQCVTRPKILNATKSKTLYWTFCQNEALQDWSRWKEEEQYRLWPSSTKLATHSE